MSKKLFAFNIQSVVDVITNSSTEVYVIKETEEMKHDIAAFFSNGNKNLESYLTRALLHIDKATTDREEINETLSDIIYTLIDGEYINSYVFSEDAEFIELCKQYHTMFIDDDIDSFDANNDIVSFITYSDWVSCDDDEAVGFLKKFRNKAIDVLLNNVSNLWIMFISDNDTNYDLSSEIYDLFRYKKGVFASRI